MALYFKMEISLKIQAPFLCSATGPGSWGIDLSFNRNHEGKLSIPKSHIKGKLREAWRELKKTGAFSIDINRWLGKGSGDDAGDYTPHRGLMIFSDFVCSDKQDFGQTHRIRIEKTSGTAGEGALITAETPHLSGKITKWSGEIAFPAVDQTEGERVKEHILTGLRWITALGAEKGVGYGRLVEVTSEHFNREESRTDIISSPSDTIGLAITMVDPLMIGGVRIKDNYLKSEKILTGTVIKGALAQCVRRRLNLNGNQELNKSTPGATEAGISNLVRHFEQLRITHAFPSRQSMVRPVKAPLSLVKARDLHDIALCKEPELIYDKAPAFAIDWKDSSDVNFAYGWAQPKTLARTRTAIDTITRRAEEEKLYTFEYICPVDDQDKEITWLSNIYLPENLNEDEREKLSYEICLVAHNWFDYIGKRDSRIKTVRVSSEPWPSAVSGLDISRDKITVLTLQSDALILDPWELKVEDKNSLFEAYKESWNNISDGAFELKRFFAAQKLRGGYIGRRFRINRKYYPFFLTNAKSVFVLEIKDQAEAERRVEIWLRRGLPIPDWAFERYGRSSGGRLDWQKCPFTPENGFGEIIINLSCHWEHAPGGCND
ncbi:MAG: hypothetical protein JRE64_09910 [Deltaproteobacteria bacterium]|nr:hypothetical protein [Deltaproteobacteria bacterium]